MLQKSSRESLKRPSRCWRFKSACAAIVDVDVTVRKFYTVSNAILSRVKYA